MKSNLFFLCLAGFAINTYAACDTIFDNQTFKAARLQIHLTRKQAELQNSSKASSEVLRIEILRIEKKLKALKEDIFVSEPALKPPFDRLPSYFCAYQRACKVNDCVLFLIEKEIRLCP